MVKSGQRVGFHVPESVEVGLALAARIDELRNVHIYAGGERDFGWYDPGWEQSFHIELPYVLPQTQRAIAERRCDFRPGSIFLRFMPTSMTEPIDVLILKSILVSLPQINSVLPPPISMTNDGDWSSTAPVKLSRASSSPLIISIFVPIVLERREHT